MPKGHYERKPKPAAPEIEAENADVLDAVAAEITQTLALAPIDMEAALAEFAKANSAEPDEVPPQAALVHFRSRLPEPAQFYLLGNKGYRNPDNTVGWKFSAEDAERVRRHQHFVQQRIVEV